MSAPATSIQSRLESYKTAKESQTTEQIKAALEAKMNKATTKHEDIIKAKVEAAHNEIVRSGIVAAAKENSVAPTGEGETAAQ